MFGCIGRLGCLIALAVLLGIGWFTRGIWLPRVRPAAPESTAPTAVVWEPLTPEGAQRARAQVAALAGRSGPVFANVRPGDLAAYIFTAAGRQLPASAQDSRAAVIGERLYIRTTVAMADLGGARVLGPLAGMLSARDTVTLGGSFEVLQPGLAQFRVQDVRFRQLALPTAMIPRVVSQMRRGSVPPSIAPDGLAIEVPAHVGDVRVGKGRVTLYKATQ